MIFLELSKTIKTTSNKTFGVAFLKFFMYNKITKINNNISIFWGNLI